MVYKPSIFFNTELGSFTKTTVKERYQSELKQILGKYMKEYIDMKIRNRVYNGIEYKEYNNLD